MPPVHLLHADRMEHHFGMLDQSRRRASIKVQIRYEGVPQ
jgi:hypothetical protein